MAHTHKKSANGKPIDGCSLMEVHQALQELSLPEDHILAICALANPPKPYEPTNKKTNKNPTAQDPRHSSSLSPISLALSSPSFLPFTSSPSKPSLNPYLSLPSSTNDTHLNNLKQNKKGKSSPLIITAPLAPCTAQQSPPSWKPSSTNNSPPTLKPCNLSPPNSTTPQIPLPASPPTASDPPG